MNTETLTTRTPSGGDIDAFAYASTSTQDERDAAERLCAYLSEALQRSIAAQCVLDGASRPVALLGCIPPTEGQGAVWVHLTKRAQEVPLSILQETFTAWTKTEAIERFPVLFAGPAFSALHLALLHAAGFVLMEPEEGAPFRVMAFRRASRDPSPLRAFEVRGIAASTQAA